MSLKSYGTKTMQKKQQKPEKGVVEKAYWCGKFVSWCIMPMADISDRMEVEEDTGENQRMSLHEPQKLWNKDNAEKTAKNTKIHQTKIPNRLQNPQKQCTMLLHESHSGFHSSQPLNLCAVKLVKHVLLLWCIPEV